MTAPPSATAAATTQPILNPEKNAWLPLPAAAGWVAEMAWAAPSAAPTGLLGGGHHARREQCRPPG